MLFKDCFCNLFSHLNIVQTWKLATSRFLIVTGKVSINALCSITKMSPMCGILSIFVIFHVFHEVLRIWENSHRKSASNSNDFKVKKKHFNATILCFILNFKRLRSEFIKISVLMSFCKFSRIRKSRTKFKKINEKRWRLQKIELWTDWINFNITVGSFNSVFICNSLEILFNFTFTNDFLIL